METMRGKLPLRGGCFGQKVNSGAQFEINKDHFERDSLTTKSKNRNKKLEMKTVGPL